MFKNVIFLVALLIAEALSSVSQYVNNDKKMKLGHPHCTVHPIFFFSLVEKKH